ncbi:hypothetical protein QFC20_004255 [Naganishia adeliensis]|uniref:Uncharacterized protein n=1 Tax=Naganishia adeliensis TaxID=92952 RepID=A0ACC2W2Z9_9TREE|nr:hypothetical protein QFC20_004255 [Naganishia adeliensis]
MTSGSIIYAYLALGAQAVLPIILGSFASVKTPRSIRKAIKDSHARTKLPKAGEPQGTIPHPDDTYYALEGEQDPEDDQDDDDEKVGLQDSLWFPLIASCALFGFFLLFKFVDPIWINRIISTYFAGASVFAIHLAGSDFINSVIRRTTGKPASRCHLRIEKGFKELIHVTYTKSGTIMIPFAIAIPAIYTYLGKPWYITNMLSFSFAYSAIKAMKLDGFATGAALLAGLFLYDIFWVFGTPVMENVAKSLDAPIKVLAPRNMSDWSAGFTMLGLGDIVLPGVFISLALRYDYANHVQRRLKAEPGSTPTKRDRYVKPYFFAVLVAYVLGLVTTVVVMHRFKAAQPALLYLSPACIGSISLLAWSRSEFPATFKWKDEDPADKGKEKVAEPEKTAAIGGGGERGQAFDTSASILLEQSSVIGADSPLQNFLRWDALYYFKIALDGYRFEQELAFLPGWPLCMRLAGEAVRYLRNLKGKASTDLDVFDVLVGGVFLANALSVAASVAFYKLTSRVSANKTFALYASYLYILTTSPATASSPYTEPLFAFLTCTGLYLVLPSRISKKSGASLVLSKILGLVCLAAATGTRSLGILNMLVIAWQAFLQPIIQGDRRVSIVINRGFLTAAAAAFIVLPFVGFQYLAYRSYCSDGKTTRPWCDHALPSVYNFVQDHYWNVGFLRYWTLPQLPNFLLASPVMLSAIYTVYNYALQASSRAPGNALASDSVGYLLVHLVTTWILLFSSHTQIALRTMGGNPFFWWGLAHQVWKFADGSGTVRTTRIGRIWIGWAVVWSLVSTVLWAGFYPPA